MFFSVAISHMLWLLRVVSFLGMSAWLAACAGRPGPEILEPVTTRAKGAHEITVYSATSRSRAESRNQGFTTERSRENNFNSFMISLPPGRRAGQIDWPRGAPDPAWTVAVLDQNALTEREFLSTLSASARSTNGEVSVFVHGYNQNFQQALFRLAQMAGDNDPESQVILFSWPSQANMIGYVADRDAATYSRDNLVKLLAQLARTPHIRKINIAAHSMGSWLTMEAIRQLRLTGEQSVLDCLQVGLAAPDIDIDVFEAQMEVIGALKMPIYILVSQDDHALQVSQYLGRTAQRLGAIDVKDPQIEEVARKFNIAFIDISSLKTSDALNHGRYAMMASIFAHLAKHEKPAANQQLQRAGAFIFNSVGATLWSHFILGGQTLSIGE